MVVDTAADQTAAINNSSRGVDMGAVNRQPLPPRLLLLLLPPRQTIHTLRMVVTRPIVLCTTPPCCSSKQQPEVRRALPVRLVPKAFLSLSLIHHHHHSSSSYQPTITVGSFRFPHDYSSSKPINQPRVM